MMDNTALNAKIRVWVTSDNERLFKTGSRSLIFHVRKKEFLNLMKFIDVEHSIWTMVVVYVKDNTNTELKRYYNFYNNRTFPISNDELV